MEPAPSPRFDLWIPAVESGLLPLPRLVAWADAHILRLSEPPRWLIELSMTGDVDGLELAREFAPADGGGQGFDRGRMYLGSLYLAFERGLLPMDKLLLEAGQFADACASNNMPECEAFYLLLNEIDGGGPTVPSSRPLAERVRELFALMTEEARRPCRPPRRHGDTLERFRPRRAMTPIHRFVVRDPTTGRGMMVTP